MNTMILEAKLKHFEENTKFIYKIKIPILGKLCVES